MQMGKRKGGIFGAPMLGEGQGVGPSASPAASALAPSTTTSAFVPKRSFLDKLGLVADAFSGNSMNAQQLAARDDDEYRRYTMDQQRYSPQQVGSNIVRLNPQTGQYETLYSAPQKDGAGTALQQNYEYLKTINPAAAESYLAAQTTAPPIVQTNPDGTKTIYPAGQIPRAGAMPQRQVIQQLPPGVRPIGGGAPSQGGATFR